MNLDNLKQLIKYISEDMNIIFEEWDNNDNHASNYKIIFPDQSTSHF